jgi:regulator of nucleoside diphosphate kinase
LTPAFARQDRLTQENITKPTIIITSDDAERLERLLAAQPNLAFPGREDLEAELARATIVPAGEIPRCVVTMNSTVRFRIDTSLKVFYLKLVFPHDADVNGGTISILAPVGSALLGLSEGDEILWPKPGGGVMRVTIDEVCAQPQRSEDSLRKALSLPVFRWQRPNESIAISLPAKAASADNKVS